MNFLTHVVCYSFGVSRIVRWLVRLRIRVARPIARGRNRLIVGPSSAWTALTYEVLADELVVVLGVGDR